MLAQKTSGPTTRCGAVNQLLHATLVPRRNPSCSVIKESIIFKTVNSLTKTMSKLLRAIL